MLSIKGLDFILNKLRESDVIGFQSRELNRKECLFPTRPSDWGHNPNLRYNKIDCSRCKSTGTTMGVFSIFQTVKRTHKQRIDTQKIKTY